MEQILNTQVTQTSNGEPQSSGKPTTTDTLFLIFLGLVLVSLVTIARLYYIEGMKLETTKRNGEAWAEWFTKASNERFNAGFEPSACAGGTENAHTWGECFSALTASGNPLALMNPFFETPLTQVAECDKVDRSIIGSISIDKLEPNAPGSTLPFTVSQLTESDKIDQKLKIRIAICDNGSYPIQIAETDF
jgi:hypothetical protein